jgi:hypothetical protein
VWRLGTRADRREARGTKRSCVCSPQRMMFRDPKGVLVPVGRTGAAGKDLTFALLPIAFRSDFPSQFEPHKRSSNRGVKVIVHRPSVRLHSKIPIINSCAPVIILNFVRRTEKLCLSLNIAQMQSILFDDSCE